MLALNNNAFLFLRRAFSVLFLWGVVAQKALGVTHDGKEVTIKLETIEPQEIDLYFQENSVLNKLKDRDIKSSRFLDKLIQDDIKMLYEVLSSYGHFGSKVLVEKLNSTDKIDIIYKIENPGRYRYSALFIKDSTTKGPLENDIEKLILKEIGVIGDNINATALQEKFSQVERELKELGYPFAEIANHLAILNHPSKTASLEVMVALGEKVLFGELYVEGNKKISENYIMNRKPWADNQLFKKSSLEKYQEKLYQTGLFNQVSVSVGKQSIKNGKIDVIITVQEREERSLKAGIKYSLSDGAGVQAGWEHRNFSGRSDKLSPKIKIGQRETKLDINYRLPDFWRINTELLSTVELGREHTKAFDVDNVGGLFSFRTQYNEHLNSFYGVSLDISKVTKNSKTQHNKLFGVPLGIDVNKANSILDPTKGYRFSATLTPEFGSFGKANFMSKALMKGSFYMPLMTKTTWANWAKLGTVLGIKHTDIPADRRFYAGGGGSVRAYAYQLAGPIDSENNPLGGKTLFEVGTELRHRFSTDWGGVIFIEGAHVGQESLPKLSEKFFYGAGCGLRYYTAIGPIRLDVAVPLTKVRNLSGKTMNRSFQFYISLGQSF